MLKNGSMGGFDGISELFDENFEMKNIMAPCEFFNYAENGDEAGVGVVTGLYEGFELKKFFCLVRENFFFRPQSQSISQFFPPIPGTL